jgi:hypothetical protein
MYPQLETMFDEAENRYLKTEELSTINQYVNSLPGRLDAYRTLRDQELNVMQRVADQLQLEMPQEKVENLERSIKIALLMLRSCGMGMLLSDESYLQDRLLNYVGQTMQVYNTRSIDLMLFRLLNQQLSQVMTAKQMSHLKPMLMLAQSALLQQAPTRVSTRVSNSR